MFSNEKPPPQWQECNAHWSAPYYTIHYTSLEIEESTEHSAFTILLLAEAEVTLAFDWKDRNQKWIPSISIKGSIQNWTVILFVVKIASDAGQALKSDVLVMHGPKDQKLNYYNQGRQFWWLMHSELPTSGLPTSRQSWGRHYKVLPYTPHSLSW